MNSRVETATLRGAGGLRERAASVVSIQTQALAFRPDQAAEAIGISRSALYELLRSRKLKGRKIGGATIVLRSELERFLQALPEFQAE